MTDLRKDLLVDNTVAKSFCAPPDNEHRTFVSWLFNEGVLVVTQRLLLEYVATAGNSRSGTSMPAIIDNLTRDGRLKKFTKQELESFRFPTRIKNRLRSNREDHDNIKAVLMSVRKFALTHDVAFTCDLQ